MRDGPNTYGNSSELDKGGKDHIFRSDWVAAGFVPRCRILDEIILKDDDGDDG